MPCGGQHPYNKPESVIRLNTEYASIQLCYPEDMNQCVAALLLQDYFLSFVGSRNWQRVKKLGTISSFLSHFFPYLVIKQQYSGSFSCSRAGGWSYLVICLRACVCFAHVPKAGLSPSLICHYNTWQKGQKILRGFTGYFNIRFTVESYIRSHKTTWPTHVLKQTVEENGEGGRGGGSDITQCLKRQTAMHWRFFPSWLSTICWKSCRQYQSTVDKTGILRPHGQKVNLFGELHKRRWFLRSERPLLEESRPWCMCICAFKPSCGAAVALFLSS